MGKFDMKPLWLALALFLLAPPQSAQQESDVSLTIGFVGGMNRFHVGEIIPIELSFAASVTGAYDMETRNYDRSGRLNIEQFHVTPAGRDPLQNFYSYGGFIGGGLGGSLGLTVEPRTMREDLNEWVALDQPGHYTLYITSERVSRRGATRDVPLELRSNTLEFDVVVADPAWQQQTLSSAVSTLSIESSTREETAAALRTLRFLDTPGSLHELVQLLGAHPGPGQWNEVAGLAGSRNPGLAVRELEQGMNDPEIALNGNYLYILAKLKFQLDHEPLPPYPKIDSQQQKIWSERQQAQDRDLRALQDALYDKAAALVSSKSGTARAETVQTVLQRPSRGSIDIKPIAGLPPEEVASAFLNLSEDQQWDLLTSFWERLKLPAMASPLKKVAEQPNMKHQMLRDVALRCLYDLDPAEATPVFLEEMKHPHLDNGMFTVKGETLGMLSNETLPQFDQMLSARLEQRDDRTAGLDAQLVGRYSTNAILPKIKSIYEASVGQWDCVSEDGLVLYFLRVAPDYGVKRLAVAPSACMSNSLPAVIRMNRWSEVEPGIIGRLNDADLNRARQAAEALARFGSPLAEKALWDRLRRFRAQWAERGNELVSRPGMARDANEAMSFQFGLVEAIGHGQAWLLSNEEITALEGLTLGQERNNVKQWHWTSPVDLNVSYFRDRFLATVGQYSETDLPSLRGKLAQYPVGTKFLLIISGPPDCMTSALAAINDLASQHGFVVERQEVMD
jgi:hypothetical protein